MTTIDPTTWSTILKEAVAAQEVEVVPFGLQLDYSYWTYREYTVDMGIKLADSIDDIMTSILPEDAQGEIPVGFAIVGHVGTLKSLYTLKTTNTFQPT